MNELDKKILNALTYEYVTNMTELMTITGYGNKNYLVDHVKRLEKIGKISTIKDGRERLMKKHLPLDETKKFVDNYGITLKNYAKVINGNLKQLEKNMPLVPKKNSIKRIKTKEPLIKSKINDKDQVIEIYAVPLCNG